MEYGGFTNDIPIEDQDQAVGSFNGSAQAVERVRQDVLQGLAFAGQPQQVTQFGALLAGIVTIKGIRSVNLGLGRFVIF